MASHPTVRIIFLALLSLGAWSCGGLAGEPKSEDPDLPPQLAKLLEAQEKLPNSSVMALQDLRLVAAVQMTYFSEKGTYETPQKLQAEGYLDPEWPRTPAGSYRINCELRQEGSAFVCFADALGPGLDWYMTDSAQTVYWSPDSRPTVQSPMFGVGEEER